MIQPLSGDVSRSLVLVGRNSVLRPDRELRTALEGPIGPDASTPVGCVTEVKLCRTLRELSQTLQGQAGVAAGLGPLPVPLLRYRQEFLESLHTTVFSVSLVVQARRVLEGIEAQEPHLRGDVAPPTDPSGLDRFVAQHGDCWVRSVQLGGEVQGIFTLYAQSREEAEAMVRSIGLTLPLEGLTLSPELGSQLSRIRRETSVNSSLRVRVLGLSQAPAVGSADELVALTSSFGGLTIDAPVVLSAETRGYEEIPELMSVFQPVVANRQLFCGTASKQGLLRRKERLLEIANQCSWVEETCRLYGQPPEPTLQNQGRQVRADITAIDELSEAFAQSASSTLQVPELPALLQGSPRLVPMIRDGHRLGGEGGGTLRLQRPLPGHPASTSAVEGGTERGAADRSNPPHLSAGERSGRRRRPRQRVDRGLWRRRWRRSRHARTRPRQSRTDHHPQRQHRHRGGSTGSDQ